MSISDKVVPIEKKKSQIIARDTKAQRIILAIGGERLAIDFSTRVSKLAPGTGDEPGGVVPITGQAVKKVATKGQPTTPAQFND